MENVNVSEWIRCPVCGNKTRDKMRENTVLENFPLFCPKCKRETLISVTLFVWNSTKAVELDFIQAVLTTIRLHTKM